MGCCGQAVAGRLSITQREIDEGLAIQVEYQGGRTAFVMGPFTGKVYEFSGLKRIENIDPRDAPGLLRDSRFRFRGIVRAMNSFSNGT